VRNSYKEFMEICDYTEKEIQKEMPRVKRFFEKTGLNEEDAKRGKDRLINYYQCGELRGMRMHIGALMKWTVDIVLAKEEGKKTMWNELPQGMNSAYLGAVHFVDSNIVVGSPGLNFFNILGGVFGKLDHMWTWAEENFFTQGVAHCACNFTVAGGRALGAIPPGDLTIMQGIYCDEAPKTGELIEHVFGERVFYINRCQDEYLFEPPGGERQVAYLAGAYELLQQEMSKVAGAEITDEMVKQNLMNYYLVEQAKIKEIEDLRVMSDPQVLRVQAWNLLWIFHVFSPGKPGFEERMEALQVLYDELKGMVDRGEGITEKGAPKIIYAPMLPFVDPEYGKVLEDAGINVCCNEVYSTQVVNVEQSMAFMALPAPMLFASMWLSVPLLYVHTRGDSIVQNYKQLEIDGILLLAHYACRIIGSDMIMVKEFVRKELGPDVPLAVLDYDIYDNRYYNHEQARTRLESFAEMVKSAKQSRAKFAA